MYRAPMWGIGMDLVSCQNLSEWKGTIIGPPDCPFEGGRFKLSIVFPADCKKVPILVLYGHLILSPSIDPFKPPRIKFIVSWGVGF